MFDSIAVEEVATPAVATVGADRSVRHAARQMRSVEIGSLVVIDDGPAGIVTQSDLRDVVADGLDPETPVSSVMSAPLVTVGPDETVATAVDRAREASVTKLPVVAEGGDGDDGEELVGIVTTTDLTYSLPDLTDRLSEAAVAEEAAAEDPRVTHDAAAETAYEHDDWTFEYVTSEDSDDATVAVGDLARFSITVDEAAVEAFATATGDANRLFLDEEFAADSRFGQRVVYGTLATGVVDAALTRLPGLTLALSTEMRYHAPIAVGDRVLAVCEVTDRIGDREYGAAVTVYDADGEVVVTGTATVLAEELPD